MDSLGHHGRHCRPGRPFPRPLGSEAGYQVSVTWPQLRQGSMTFDVIMLLFLVATRKVPRGRAGCDPFPLQGGEPMSSWKHARSALVLSVLTLTCPGRRAVCD